MLCQMIEVALASNYHSKSALVLAYPTPLSEIRDVVPLQPYFAKIILYLKYSKDGLLYFLP